MPNSIQDIDKFFSKVRSLEANYWSNRLVEEKTQFTSFIEREILFQKEIKAIRQKETPYYNIFEVLNIRHRETKTHTPFLVHLLNPKASHEQGALFLNAFFKDVLGTDFRYEEMMRFEVYEEKNTNYGRVDIYLEFSINNQAYGIVIENKIYAGNQPQQLERYYNYLRRDEKLCIKNIMVVYLTVNKKRAERGTIRKSLSQLLYNQNVLVDIGYKEDLINWLVKCQKKCTSEMVKYTLKQYQQTITYL